MGQWVTVHLAYGFDLGAGVPEFLYGQEEGDSDPYRDISTYWYRWWDQQRQRLQLLGGQAQELAQLEKDEKSFDILLYHSYDERYTRYFLALKASVQTGYSDQPMIPNIYEISTDIFKNFCNQYKVPYQEPQWQIVSLYG